MTSQANSRRQFLISSACDLTCGWVALHWPAIVRAQQHAHDVAASSEPAALQFFSAQQAGEVEALAAQIIPTDDTPGAREAHVIYFIDRALSTFDRAKQPAYIEGLSDLRARTRAMFPAAGDFSKLASEQQIHLLKGLERTAFFETVRIHTVMGFLSNPEYGGNYNKVGWKLLGFEDNFYYQPPFGYYDAHDVQTRPHGKAGPVRSR